MMEDELTFLRRQSKDLRRIINGLEQQIRYIETRIDDIRREEDRNAQKEKNQ